MDPRQREELILKYARGPKALRAALRKTPRPALTWRPGPGRWSAHEVLAHCADAELNAAARARYLVAEKRPLIVGYDQDGWATTLDYHRQRREQCLALLDAVVDHTVGMLRRAPASAWRKKGRHTEHAGAYTLERWLEIYSRHMANHAAQIERNVTAWQARGKARRGR